MKNVELEKKIKLEMNKDSNTVWRIKFFTKEYGLLNCTVRETQVEEKTIDGFPTVKTIAREVSISELRKLYPILEQTNEKFINNEEVRMNLPIRKFVSKTSGQEISFVDYGEFKKYYVQ
jgi:hypothetical protein